MKNEKISLLIIDDEDPARLGIKKTLSREGFEIYEAGNGAEGIGIAKETKADIIITDMVMPGINGLELLKQFKEFEHKPLVIFMTAFGNERLAVDVIKAGAYDYVGKPYDVDELRMVVRNAASNVRLSRENEELRTELKIVKGKRKIIGESRAIREVFELIDKVSKVDITVLILGESGTGKELAAHSIHEKSHRAGGPFVAINCAAIPTELLESELFGHEKGAFTGANYQRIGKFESANGGILFLDEIGDMALETQAKVLRLLQEGTFERLGSSETNSADVRIISATSKDLVEGIKDGWFREDLYYRIKVVELLLPPLRKRMDDIALLVDHFISFFNSKHNKKINKVNPDAMSNLVNREWPGNVRELMNVIEKAVALSDGASLSSEDIDSTSPGKSSHLILPRDLNEMPFQKAKQAFTRSFEEDYFSTALQRQKGNVSRTAQEIGIKRQYLHEKLKKLGINAQKYKSS